MRQYLIRPSIIFITLFISIFLTSCITSSKDKDQRRLALYFLTENFNVELNINDQIIIVDEFKFALDRFNLYADNDVVLQTSGDVTALIYSYNKNIISDRLILDVDLGFRDVDRFIGYELFVEPVSNRTGVLDTDFFGQQNNYSIIITGTINDIDFTYRSEMEFDRRYDFNVDFNQVEDTETLLVRNIIDIKNVFTSSDGGFLDPNDPANDEKIVNNIREFLIVQASATSIFEAP